MSKPILTNRRMHWAGVLCLLLLAFSNVAQALHNHNNEPLRNSADPVKSRCSICVVSQSPAQAAVDVSIPQDVTTEIAVLTWTDLIIVKELGFASSIRPPPAQ